MKYPQSLLPQPTFKEIVEDLSKYFICRKVSGKVDLDVGLPDEKLLGMDTLSECFDYSTNLPGVFELWHNTLELTGENKRYFRSYWDWESTAITPAYKVDFKLNNEVSWFFLRIGAVEKISIPFNKNAKNQPDDVLSGLVSHTPTNCNFWHFSIKWKNSKGEFINTNKSAWKHNIIATIRALLMQLMTTKPVRQEIMEGWFKK